MERGRDENLEKGARYKRQPSQPSAFARVFVRFCSMTSSIAAAHDTGILIFKANERYSTTVAHGARILIFKLFKKPKPDKHSPAHVDRARR
jgi:hypothetical protein